ncbi:MAG: macro domain-containing protein [Oscillospiraceae bacterium]|nr:macro domain-containing protein [Oscillospiraceae bacterium]
MPFQIIRNDITKVKADVIVNTVNPKPVIGGGTDSAINKAAGEEKLLTERQKIGHIARGEMAVTPAFDLKAKYIIHTVGPIWEGGSKGEFDILRSCYRKSLEKAAELGCESVAFPLIATGVYGFPKDKALQIAMSEIGSFLMQDGTEMTVKLVVFGDKAFRLSRNLFFQVESFITDEEVIKAHLDEYGIEQEEFDHIKDRYRREREYERYYPANRPTGVLDFSDECELSETVEFGDIHIGSVGSSSKKPVIKKRVRLIKSHLMSTHLIRAYI